VGLLGPWAAEYFNKKEKDDAKDNDEVEAMGGSGVSQPTWVVFLLKGFFVARRRRWRRHPFWSGVGEAKATAAHSTTVSDESSLRKLEEADRQQD